MVDAFGSFLQGMEAGKAESAAKRKAQAERLDELQERARDQFNKDRTESRLADAQSQVVRGAAEDEIGRLESTISSDDWDGSPQMVIGALTQADRIQRDYGPVLSFDVREYISKKMNLGGGSPADEGKQGPPSPGADSPHAGFTGPLQKSKAGATARALKTKVAMGPILGDAMKYLQGNAFTNGVPDPKKVPLALLEHQLMTLQSPDIDKEVAIAAYNQFEDDVYKAVETVKEASVDADKERERIETTGKGVTSFARTLFGLKEGMMASVLSKEDRAAFTKINDAGQRLARKGYHLPVIEMMLVDRMTDSEFNWLKKNAEDQIQGQSFQALRDAPNEFQVVLQNILSQVNPDTGEPLFDPLEVKAAYNKETKEGTLLWNTYDEKHGNEVMGGPVYIFRGMMPLRGGR